MSASSYTLSARAAEAEARRSAPQASASQTASSADVIVGNADVFEWFAGYSQAAGMTVTPATAVRSTPTDMT